MDERELAELIEVLYPHFIKKMKTEGFIKNAIKSTNAVVTFVDTSESNIGKAVRIKFPYDDTEIEVINKSSKELEKDDLVCIHYNIDLKNAYVAYTV